MWRRWTNLRRVTYTKQVAQSHLRSQTCAESLTQQKVRRVICVDQLVLTNLHRAICTRSQFRKVICTEQLAQIQLRRDTGAKQLAQTRTHRATPSLLRRATFADTDKVAQTRRPTCLYTVSCTESFAQSRLHRDIYTERSCTNTKLPAQSHVRRDLARAICIDTSSLRIVWEGIVWVKCLGVSRAGSWARR